jgi:hypothetical protein
MRRATRRRQRIARLDPGTAQCLIAKNEILNSLSAHVPSRAVANAVVGLKGHAGIRLVAQPAVTKAQMAIAIIIHFSDKGEIVGTTLQQIGNRQPELEQSAQIRG